jgi:hypothetical protein
MSHLESEEQTRRENFSHNIKVALSYFGSARELGVFAGVDASLVMSWIRKPPIKIVGKSRNSLKKIAALLTFDKEADLFIKKSELDKIPVRTVKAVEKPKVTLEQIMLVFDEIQELDKLHGRDIVTQWFSEIMRNDKDFKVTSMVSLIEEHGFEKVSFWVNQFMKLKSLLGDDVQSLEKILLSTQKTKKEVQHA